MAENLTNALYITLLGMGLVFVGILLLWGMMALMVRFIKDPVQAAEESPAPTVSPEVPDVVTPARKKRALAAALATAILLRQSAASTTVQKGETVSPWQAVLRAGNMAQRTELFTRKNRGR